MAARCTSVSTHLPPIAASSQLTLFLQQNVGSASLPDFPATGASLMTELPMGRPSRLRTWSVLIYLFLAFMLTLPCACSGNERPVVGPIEFVDSSGAAVSAVNMLSVSGAVYLVGTVTDDNEMLGVSWTVSCGSLPAGGGSSGIISTACGVFNPTQTMSGPIPTYPSTGIITQYTAPSIIPKGNAVTITAHATSLPSVISSVTLTIVQGP